MKSQTQSTDPGEPSRKLPFVEKQSRLESQKKRIVGLLHTTDQQPSHGLIDVVFNMVETGSIVYIHPSKCHVSCTCSCVFYNGFLFMKYILAQEDIHVTLRSFLFFQIHVFRVLTSAHAVGNRFSHCFTLPCLIVCFSWQDPSGRSRA